MLPISSVHSTKVLIIIDCILTVSQATCIYLARDTEAHKTKVKLIFLCTWKTNEETERVTIKVTCQVTHRTRIQTQDFYFFCPLFFPFIQSSSTCREGFPQMAVQTLFLNKPSDQKFCHQNYIYSNSFSLSYIPSHSPMFKKSFNKLF